MSMYVTKAAVAEAAVAYTQQIVRAPYLGSVFGALLIKPDTFQFSEFGGETAYRAITGANAVTYDPSRGWGNTPNTGSAKWVKVRDTLDRAFSFAVDYMTEVSSILSGMPLSGVEIMNASWMRYGKEVDMIALSRLYASTTSRHVNTEAGWKVDKDNIFNTLTNIETAQLDKGIPATEKRITAISSTAYNALRAFMVEKGALYNGATLMPKTLTVRPVPSSVDPENALGVNMQVYEFNNHYLTVVPDALMKTMVTLLDGTTGGQTDGGVKADDVSAGAANIDILSVPVSAAAVSVRHIVSMLTVPLKALNVSGNVSIQLDPSMTEFAGISTIENIGVDQIGDQFGYKNRVRYDAIALENYKDSIIAVTSTPVSGD